MLIQNFIDKGVTVKNNMGEIRTVRVEEKYISIPFKNGWVASIHKENGKYNVATCDYDGYFNWNILKPFGNDNGTIDCDDEEELCKTLAIIESLN